MTVDSDGEQRQRAAVAAVVALVVAVARAADVRRAREALDLFDQVRAVTWRLLQPRK